MRTRILVVFLLLLALPAAGYSLFWLLASQSLLARITDEAHIRSQGEELDISWKELDMGGFPFAMVATFREPAIEDKGRARVWRGTEARITMCLFGNGTVGVDIVGAQEIGTTLADGSLTGFFVNAARLHLDLEARDGENDLRLTAAHAERLEVFSGKGHLLFAIRELDLQGDLHIDEHRQIDGFLQLRFDKEGTSGIPPLLRSIGAVEEIPGENRLAVEANFRDGRILIGEFPLVKIGPLY